MIRGNETTLTDNQSPTNNSVPMQRERSKESPQKRLPRLQRLEEEVWEQHNEQQLWALQQETQQGLSEIAEKVKAKKCDLFLSRIEKTLEQPKGLKRSEDMQVLLQEFRDDAVLHDAIYWRLEEMKIGIQENEEGKVNTAHLLEKRNVIMMQLYGNLTFDETVSVDGIIGPQTKDICAAVMEEGKLTERATLWRTMHANVVSQREAEKKAEEEKKKNDSKPNEVLLHFPQVSSSPTLLNQVGIQEVFANNGTNLETWMNTVNLSMSPEKAQEVIKKIFFCLEKFLDIYTPEHKNFLKDFVLDANNDITIDERKLQITGTIKNETFLTGNANYGTPVSLSYDILSWDFAINTLLQTDPNQDSFHLNSANTNQTLFTLPPFADLEDEDVDISSDIKEKIEFDIERNRVIATTFSLFDLDRSTTNYAKIENPGMFHLCSLLINSLRTTEQCRSFRQEISRLYTIINGEKISNWSETEMPNKMDQSLSTTDKEINESQKNDEDLVKKSPLLHGLFNTVKRKQDKEAVGTINDTENWLYLFFKIFLERTPSQPSTLTSSYYDESQKINIEEIWRYLSLVEQGRENEYLGIEQGKVEDYTRYTTIA